LFDDIVTSLVIGFKIGFQEIWKEENLQYQKYDNQLNGNNYPKFFTNGHAFKTLIIK